MQKSESHKSLLTEREPPEAAVSAVVLMLTGFCFCWEHLSLALFCLVFISQFETPVSMCRLRTTGGAKLGFKVVKSWISQVNQCTWFNSMTTITEHHKGLYCFFLFVDLNSVSSRETGVIIIRLLICISEFPILPLKAATSVQAVPPHTPLSSALPAPTQYNPTVFTLSIA